MAREKTEACTNPYKNIVQKSWSSVDLKALLAILSLAEPPISQAKVASLLKVSPVTLSRLVNSNDHNVRESWVPVLSDCLTNVDMDIIKETVDSLYQIHRDLQEKKLATFLRSSIESYLLKQNSNYKFDDAYWGQANNILRFHNEDENNQWFFSFEHIYDNTPWKFRHLPLGPFTRFKRMRSISENDRISILYSDPEVFVKNAILSKNNFNCTEPIDQMSNYCSFILCNPEDGRVMEEYVVFDPATDFGD